MMPFHRNIKNGDNTARSNGARGIRSQCGRNGDGDDDDNTGLSQLFGMPRLNVYMESNHIYFRDDVSMESVGKLTQLIDAYNRSFDELSNSCKLGVVEPLPLYLHITSYGGDLLAGFLAYDYIKGSKINIYTVSEGYTVSSGSVMFMAGYRRLMTRNSYFLAHQLSQSSYGCSKFADIMDTAQNTTEFMRNLYKIYLDNIRHTIQPIEPNHILTKEKLEQHMTRDIYWNFQQCLEYGIVDEEYVNLVECKHKDIQTIRSGRVQRQISSPTIDEDQTTPSKQIIKRAISQKKRSNRKNDADLQKELARAIMSKIIEDGDQVDDSDEIKEPVRVHKKRKTSRKN